MESVLYTSAAFGLALGTSILPFGRKQSAEKWMVGGLLIIGTLAVASIARQHQLSASDEGGLLEAFEIGPGFAFGPLLFLFCRRGRGRDLPGWLIATHFLPALMVSVQILLLRRYVLPIELMVGHQMVYTILSFGLVTSSLGSSPTSRWPLRLCWLAATIHLAQVIRMTFASVEPLRNMVPITIVGALAAAAFLILREHLTANLALLSKPHHRSALVDEAADRLTSRLADVMAESKPWLDPDLNLHRLALAVGASPHHLSELLNGRMTTTFHELVATSRLAESKRLLIDPANDVFTIEAIARRSGFSSRSAFYATFRREFGVTPTQYRKQARQAPDPSCRRPVPSQTRPVADPSRFQMDLAVMAVATRRRCATPPPGDPGYDP